MNFIETLFNWFMQLMPFRIVYSYQYGVRWFLGKNPQLLEPGLRWCLPGVHEMLRPTRVEHVRDLPIASVSTRDDVSVCFSVNIGQVFVDPIKMLCEVHDFKESSQALAMTYLSARVREMTWDDLRNPETVAQLEKDLTEVLKNDFSAWGTQVTRVGFTDLVRVRQQMRLFQDQAASYRVTP